MQQHQAINRQPVHIHPSINKQFILMKAHLTFAIRMVYYFINIKKVKGVPFQTTSKMLPQLNFALWIQFYTL